MQADRTFLVHAPDPVVLAYRRLRGRCRNLGLCLVFAVAFVCLVGLPHVGWTYTYRETPSGKVKLSADYWSVSGWRKVKAGQYAEGCPFLIFVPLRDVVDFTGSL